MRSRKLVKGPDSPSCDCAQLSAHYLIVRPRSGFHFTDCASNRPPKWSCPDCGHSWWNHGPTAVEPASAGCVFCTCKAYRPAEPSFAEPEVRVLAAGAEREPVENMSLAEKYGGTAPLVCKYCSWWSQSRVGERCKKCLRVYGEKRTQIRLTGLTAFTIAQKLGKLIREAERAGIAIVVDSDAVAIHLMPRTLVDMGANLRNVVPYDTVRVHGACGGGGSRRDSDGGSE